MILDTGICSVFARSDRGQDGNMPGYAYRLRCQGWYKLLQFETSPANPTDDRIERQTDARIRILQCTDLHEMDVVVLMLADALPESVRRYEVTRAYHGFDDDNGQPITDLTLREVSPWN